jgi:hypothetical protein
MKILDFSSNQLNWKNWIIKKPIKLIRIFKKIFGSVRSRFYKSETEKPNKKINQTKITKPNKKTKPNPLENSKKT